MALRRRSRLQSSTAKTSRVSAPTAGFDETVSRDWMGWWFNQEYGKTRLTGQEMMDREHRMRISMTNTVRMYFTYMWDADLGRIREVEPARDKLSTLAENWVGVQYDVLLEFWSQGTNLRDISIEFDNKKNRDV